MAVKLLKGKPPNDQELQPTLALGGTVSPKPRVAAVLDGAKAAVSELEHFPCQNADVSFPTPVPSSVFSPPRVPAPSKALNPRSTPLV
ncbi:hypothetical protein FA15DRAFT_665025 [Coprinopsis marcescibilis]|uniref:Uncharacterized protein n=1 Tax=Coprinopsis marcescibilis TaxID=230819 RepID=A0A5C3L770_COPMA|nr:hypothetical protein FA15DRAFT_665025 [Coprinopsis marcescibilis]